MSQTRTRGALFWAAAAFLLLDAVTIAPARAQEPPALAELTDSAEKARVQKLIEGARKEGALSIIGVQVEPQHADGIFAAFKKHYGLDSLRAEYTYTGTGEIVTRIEQLLRAKRNNFDVVWTVSWAWYKDLVKRGEMMQYESPYYAQYTLSDKAGLSLKGYWVSDSYVFAPLYNPAMLEQKGITNFNPTSWGDFVDPRLKGLTAMIDVLVSTSAAPVLSGSVKVMGDQWLTALGKNQPVLHIKANQGREWVGAGEFGVALLTSPKDALSLKQRNIKAKMVFPKEGIVLMPFAPIILKSAPHPNVSQLFIDFVRSARGAQAMMDSGTMLFHGRPGVKSSDTEILPAAEDVKAIPFDWDQDASNQAIKQFRDKVRAAGIGSK
ncbi:MAG: extracellular solute-binding protein [Variibacter sp.]|nr:extracellular solute-binding protein [Variibacter sp.]